MLFFKRKLTVNSNPVAGYTIFISICLLYFGAALYKIIIEPSIPAGEYNNHILFAIDIAQKKRPSVPHFLFHLLTIIHYDLISIFHTSASNESTVNIEWKISSSIVILETYIGIAFLLFFHFKNVFYGKLKEHVYVAYVVAFSVSICAPVFLLAPIDGLYYIGYITPSTIYIIPTQIILKFPALALFLLTYSCYFVKGKYFIKFYILSPALVILSALAKPNWIIVMLPALAVISLVRIAKNNYINWSSVIATLLAAFSVLGWQYYFKFIDTDSPLYKSKITITAPFEVWGHYSDFMLIKVLLSILFPLYVVIFFWNDVKENFSVKYGWLLFLIGMIYTAFLGELLPSGKLSFDGNFVWSGQIACFMLFVSSASLFFSKCITAPYRFNRKIIGIVFFCGHVFCGLIYYFRSIEGHWY